LSGKRISTPPAQDQKPIQPPSPACAETKTPLARSEISQPDRLRASTFSVGDFIRPGYQILSVIEGANSTIYKAEVVHGYTFMAGVEVPIKIAVKEVRLSDCTDWKSWDRGSKESKAGKKVQHPNLARYYDGFEDAKRFAFFQVREWVEGEPLDALHKRNALTDMQKVDAVLNVLDALIALHSDDPPIIHRDVKPPNIIVDIKDGEIIGEKLIDLGSVKFLSPNSSYTLPGTIGSKGFMAPEVLASKACIQSDLFSAGALMLYLKTGKNADDIFNPVEGTYDIPGEITDKRMRALLEKTLQSPVKKRYQSAGEMKAALLEIKRNMVTSEEQLRISGTLKEDYFGRPLSLKNPDRWDDFLAKVISIGIVGSGFAGGILGTRMMWTGKLQESLILGGIFGLFAGTVVGMVGALSLWPTFKYLDKKFQGIVHSVKRSIQPGKAFRSARKLLLSGKFTDPIAQENLAPILADKHRKRYSLDLDSFAITLPLITLTILSFSTVVASMRPVFDFFESRGYTVNLGSPTANMLGNTALGLTTLIISTVATVVVTLLSFYKIAELWRDRKVSKTERAEAYRILRSGILASEKAENELAALISDPKSASELFRSGCVKSADANKMLRKTAEIEEEEKPNDAEKAMPALGAPRMRVAPFLPNPAMETQDTEDEDFVSETTGEKNGKTFGTR